MSAAASVVAAVVLGGGGVVERGVMRGSRIPVRVGGSSVRYETSKSLKAGLGSRIPVMKGSGVRYVH